MSKKIKIWVMLGFTVIVLLLLKLLFDRRFDSVESLQNYMKGFGMADAPRFSQYDNPYEFPAVHFYQSGKITEKIIGKQGKQCGNKEKPAV